MEKEKDVWDDVVEIVGVVEGKEKKGCGAVNLQGRRLGVRFLGCHSQCKGKVLSVKVPDSSFEVDEVHAAYQWMRIERIHY